MDENGFRGGGPAAHGCCSGGRPGGRWPWQRERQRERQRTGNGNGNGNGGSNAHANGGTGHTPVTVCHRLGNGGYHVLTMDDSALKAHLGHGDLYPVPADGCPAAPAKTKTPAENPGTKGPEHSGNGPLRQGPLRPGPRRQGRTPARRTGTRR